MTLYSRFITAYPQHDQSEPDFYRTVMYLHLVNQREPVQEEDWDDWIIQYHQIYVPSESMMPYPKFWKTLRRPKQSNAAILNQRTFDPHRLYAQNTTVIRPFLVTMRSVCEEDTRWEQAMLTATRHPLTKDNLWAKVSTSPPPTIRAEKCVLPINHRNVLAYWAWMNWKDSEEACSSRLVVQQVDQRMKELVEIGDCIGVTKLGFKLRSVLVDHWYDQV